MDQYGDMVVTNRPGPDGEHILLADENKKFDLRRYILALSDTICGLYDLMLNAADAGIDPFEPIKELDNTLIKSLCNKLENMLLPDDIEGSRRAWTIVRPYIKTASEDPFLLSFEQKGPVDQLPEGVLYCLAAAKARNAGENLPVLEIETKYMQQYPVFMENLVKAYPPIQAVQNLIKVKKLDYNNAKVFTDIFNPQTPHTESLAETDGSKSLEKRYKVNTGRQEIKRKTQVQETVITPVILAFPIDESDFKSDTTLSMFDKLVYIGLSTLYDQRPYHSFTYTELFYAMGYQGRPNSRQIKQLKDSIRKMNKAMIMMTNTAKGGEIQRGYKYKPFQRETQLLSVTLDTAIDVHGQYVESFTIEKFPVLAEYASERKHIITVPIQALQSTTVSKTEKTMTINDYLIREIGRRKQQNNVPVFDIEYRKIWDTMGYPSKPDRKQILRDKETIRMLLQDKKDKKWILDFSMEKTVVKITIREDPKSLV